LVALLYVLLFTFEVSVINLLRVSVLYKFIQVSLSILTAIFPGGPWLADARNVFILDFIGAKDNGDGKDNWSYKNCKTPVKSSPPTNQHPVFYRLDALPVAQPTVSKFIEVKQNYRIHVNLM